MPEPAQANPSMQELFALGVRHLEAGRWGDAEAVYRCMLVHWPGNADIRHNLGAALKNQGKLEAAVAAFEAALALRPEYAEVLANLGDVYHQMNRVAESIAAYHRALALKPTFAEGWNNLGILLRQTNQPLQAIEAYRRALAVQENFGKAWSNLAGALKDTGQIDESLHCYARGIALQPGHAVILSNRIGSIHYHPAFDAMAIYREARQWNDRFARPLSNQIPFHANDPQPRRRLRIGYVSADFRRHCEAMFTTPLLSHHDHQAFEIFCYSAVSVPDPITARLKPWADVRRDIARLNDEAAARIIREDRIDILVDLTLHMIGSRLGVFARKPAPVQVTWLGYPGTTGVEAIDYRLTDPRLDPVEPEIRNPKSEIRINDQNPNAPISSGGSSAQQSLPHSEIGKFGFDSDFGFRISDFENRASDFATKEPYYSERSVRLPDSFWCYDPHGLDDDDSGPMPEAGPLPALNKGHITFGCLNNFCKVSDRTLELWAPVMAAIPEAHLLLVVAPGPHRQRVARKLGVAEERVEFVVGQPWRQYLETYRRIDLCLDTLPFNGGTTSLDAMWMGAPVVTRIGQTVVGRAGASHLHNLNLTELVARSNDEFTKLAVELARDLDRLAKLRATLRQRMLESPLMDAPRFAQNMEAAYRQMWRIWCNGQEARTRQC